MYRLKLSVYHSNLDEERQIRIHMHERFKLAKDFCEILWRGRYELSRLNGGCRGSDPVLYIPEFARALVLAADTLH